MSPKQPPTPPGFRKSMESRGFTCFVQDRLAKKETAFRLSLMVREGGVEPPRPE